MCVKENRLGGNCCCCHVAAAAAAVCNAAANRCKCELINRKHYKQRLRSARKLLLCVCVCMCVATVTQCVAAVGVFTNWPDVLAN